MKKIRLRKKAIPNLIAILTIILVSVFLFSKGGSYIYHSFFTDEKVEIDDNTEVELNTELTYYLKVKYDGVDVFGVESSRTQTANITSNRIKVTDPLPNGLTFKSFVTTSDGTIGAISRVDGVTRCGGRVVDDTPTSDGQWNEEHTEYTYHGLHYDDTTRTVWFYVEGIKAGCELTVGINTQTPETVDDPSTDVVETRRDFYNTATAKEGDLSVNSNTTHSWVGRDVVTQYKVTYEYTGDIPDNAPSLMGETNYVQDAIVNVATNPSLEGYVFSGWSSDDATINGTTFTMPDRDVVLKGSFERIPEPTKYEVTYSIDTDMPSSYLLPRTKSYMEGAEVNLDLPKKGTIIDGYTFLGWTSDDVTLSDTGFTMPSHSVSLKGKFERISYAVSYDFQGEIMPPNADSLIPESEKYYPGDKVKLADDPQAEGYRFTGWYSEKEFIMPNQDVAVAGEWLEQSGVYTINIEKVIDNPQEYYKKGDKVRFRIILENLNSFPVTDIVLKELLEGANFVEGTGYTVQSNDIASIEVLNPNQRLFVYSEFTMPDNNGTVYTNSVQILGSLAEGNYFLDTDENKTIASIDFSAYSGLKSPFTGDGIKSVFIVMIISFVFLTVTVYNHRKKILEKYHLPRTANYALLGIAAIALLVGSFVFNFNAKADELLRDTKSISLGSEKVSFTNEDPGSWNIEKSAEWTSKTTAQITFDIHSITKLSGNDRDIILVIDNSTSMNDNLRNDTSNTSKMNAIKTNAQELIRNTLDNQDSQISLISFASDAEIVVPFSNDVEELSRGLESIEAFGSTNYYKALVKVDEVLEDYEFQENRDVVVVFVTDGLPVKDTPAEVSKYTLMKLKYPQLTINGVQYDMGESIIPQLARITDNQFIVTDASQLDKSLFDASGVPYYYTSFQVTDFINTDAWELDSIYSTSIGKATINDNKVNWNLGRYYRPGETAKLVINIHLKDEYHEVDDLWKTNSKEEISSTILDGESEYIESTETPILQHKYNVSYDANLPAECSVEVDLPETKRYFVFDQVEIQEVELSCQGWNFMGWQIAAEKVHRINTEYFQMPSSDVILRATWTKLDISKSTSGTVHEKVTATLDQGRILNTKFKRLTGQVFTYSEITNNPDIKRISSSSTLTPDVNINSDEYIISAPDSSVPIYAWFNNDTIYYYSDADKIYLNKNSMELFKGLINLEDINAIAEFDASNMETMYTMFDYTAIKNIDPLANWNMSHVTNMTESFGNNKQLENLDGARNWDISSVKTLEAIFSNDTNLSNIDGLANWNVSNTTNIKSMFRSATSLKNVDALANWDISNVTSLGSFLNNATSLQNVNGLANWNTSNVTSLHSMFSYDEALTDISGLANWDVSNVTDMTSMFSHATKLSNFEPLKRWNTQKVSLLVYTFSFTQIGDLDDLINWNTSNVTNMSSMFENAIQLQNIDGAIRWNTGNVTTMSKMFYYNACPSGLKNVDGAKNWNTSNVTTMQEMFRGSGLTQIDGLANWDVSNITENGLKGMFSCSPNLKNVDGLADWNPQNVTNLQEFLNYNTSLENIDGLARWDMSHIINMASMFTTDKSLQNLDGLKNWDVSNVKTMRSMFASMYFDDYKAFKNWDTGNVTNMAYMFNIDYYNQKPVSLEGLENWDVSKVTDMNNMFKYNRGLTNLDELANWDVSSVENFNGMFDGTENLQDISGLADWDTSSAKTMSGMFSSELYIYNKIESLEALANWDVSNVEDMSNMFRMDRSIKNLNGLANWDTGKVKKMNGMFQYDYAIEDISSLAEWNVENLTTSNNMFDGDNKITNLIVLNNWNTYSLETSTNMFYNIPETIERPSWYNG